MTGSSGACESHQATGGCGRASSGQGRRCPPDRSPQGDPAAPRMLATRAWRAFAATRDTAVRRRGFCRVIAHRLRLSMIGLCPLWVAPSSRFPGRRPMPV